MLVSGNIALDMFVSNYPPDVRQKYGPMSPRAARLLPFVATLLYLIILVVPITGLFALQAKDQPISLLPAFVFSAVTFLVFNVYDLIILDWIFFCTIQPRAMILPGTEGMAGYRDYRFHFIGFLKGLGFSIVGGLLIAVAWVALQWLVTLLS
jgi:hypothetical protein